MTPNARLQAAIEILDRYLDGTPVEKALTNWARRSRYAGSKDRAAVRDIVFQCVRCRRSYGFQGDGDTGRGLALGYAKAFAQADLFSGGGYGPMEMTNSEIKTFEINNYSDNPNVDLDVPDWLAPMLRAALGNEFEDVLRVLKTRAPTFVRVNLSKITLENAIKLLAQDQINAIPSDLSPTALEITQNPRKINNSKALQGGVIDLQDATSQAVCRTLPDGPRLRILDYCAGGGGKSLAMADRPHAEIYAHDINQSRMGDIPARAARAGARITRLTPADMRSKAPYGVVFCDVPCSGSGAWRRSPEGKWAFSSARLAELRDIQAEILADAARLVGDNGMLAYATCSLLHEENEAQIDKFLKDNPSWSQLLSKRFSPLEGGDGFFVAHLTRGA